MRTTLAAMLGAIGLAIASVTAQAGPTLAFTFTETELAQLASPLGSVELTRNGSNALEVFVDLPTGFGFVDTGNKTPFVFNLAGTPGVTFITPAGGAFMTQKGLEALPHSGAGGFPATPFGSFADAILSSGGNGSAGGYLGDLGFTVTRAGGLATTDFTANGGGRFFAAEVANAAGNTGSIATLDPVRPISVPEPASLALFGAALVGLGLARYARPRG